MTSTYFDEALCDRALVDALRLQLGTKTVEPEVTTHFDARLFDDHYELHPSKSKFERTYGRPTTQDQIEFSTYYGMDQDNAWTIFDDYI